MLFNSYEFIFIFLPITLLVYFTFARFKLTKLATASLVIASLIFYSYWDIRYLPLLLISILFNYLIGTTIERTRSKTFLIIGITVNLALLGYFKYMSFFIRAINDTVGSGFPVPEIILPLGISFFTFTQTAFLIDAFRGETKNYSLLTYSLFVTVFPHLIAGPILYHKDMIPQFSRLRNFVFSHKNFAMGIGFFVIGLFKKVIIADTLSPWVKIAFINAQELTLIDAWVGAISYTFQLYFDFSGYSDMAIGLGLMFNFKLPINFNSPYKSKSIIEFWRRWHMTLSLFLKNYLYIPLGGNKYGNLKRMRNLIITMLLGGLWHGAGWTFIIWGGLHGIFLAINHFWRKLNKSLPNKISWILTFTCVIVAWVFFRANNIHDAISIVHAMFGFKGTAIPIQYTGKLHTLLPMFTYKNLYIENLNRQIAILSVLLIIVLKAPNTQEIMKNFKPKSYLAVIMVIMAIASLLTINKVSEFLYFQF